MTSGTPRLKLLLFVLLTSLTAAYILVDFVRLPAALGIGSYQVSVELPAANGLYTKAVVTYRGVDVGAVKDLRVTDDGIIVDLSIDNGVEIPADLVAEVHSTSAVGEQYVNLVPQSSEGALLEAGDVIPEDRTTVPVSAAELLDNTRALVDSVPLRALATTADELDKALNNSSDDVQVLLDSVISVENEATTNVDPTVSLINTLAPVLDTQRRSAPQISSYTSDLADFSEQLAASDDDLRAAVAAGPSASNQVKGLFTDLTPTLPKVLKDLGLTGEVLNVYLPSIEHVLIVLPAVIVAIQNLVPQSRMNDDYVEGNLDFKLSVNDPPVCTEGYEDAGKHRDPNDMRRAPLPKDSYCKVAPDDPRVVRGARNLPCPNDPTRRSPTAAGCGLIFQSLPGGSNDAPPDKPEPIKPPSGGHNTDPQAQFLLDLLNVLRG